MKQNEFVENNLSIPGMCLALVYALCIGGGLLLRWTFFPAHEAASITPEDSPALATSTPVMLATPVTANQNILALRIQDKYIGLLEGGTRKVSIGLSTTGRATSSDLIWESSDESIATVSNTGEITGVSAGECAITVSVKGNKKIAEAVPVSVHHLEEKEGCTYVDDVLIANKTYALPHTFDPGLDSETQRQFNEMAEAAHREGLNIYLSSGYRSYEEQLQVYESFLALYDWSEADEYSARPGFSEHQTGYVIDVNTINDEFGETQEAQWLQKHCTSYGFIIRYPEGKESVTGYQYEPWHLRYVGRDLALFLTANELTLEEYFGITSAYDGPWTGVPAEAAAPVQEEIIEEPVYAYDTEYESDDAYSEYNDYSGYDEYGGYDDYSDYGTYDYEY